MEREREKEKDAEGVCVRVCVCAFVCRLVHASSVVFTCLESDSKPRERATSSSLRDT